MDNKIERLNDYKKMYEFADKELRRISETEKGLDTEYLAKFLVQLKFIKDSIELLKAELGITEEQKQTNNQYLNL